MNNAQLKDKDLTIMNGKEKIARRSNNDRPKELLLSPNASQQQMEFAEDGSSWRGGRQTVQEVSRGKVDKLKVGATVLISGQQSGVIKYLGNLHSQPGVWAGLELHSPVGLHDGRLDDVEYFRCKPRYGGRCRGRWRWRRFIVFLVGTECSLHCGLWRWLNSRLYSLLYTNNTTITTTHHQPRLNNTLTASTNGKTDLRGTFKYLLCPLSVHNYTIRHY